MGNAELPSLLIFNFTFCLNLSVPVVQILFTRSSLLYWPDWLKIDIRVNVKRYLALSWRVFRRRRNRHPSPSCITTFPCATNNMYQNLWTFVPKQVPHVFREAFGLCSLYIGGSCIDFPVSRDSSSRSNVKDYRPLRNGFVTLFLDDSDSPNNRQRNSESRVQLFSRHTRFGSPFSGLRFCTVDPGNHKPLLSSNRCVCTWADHHREEKYSHEKSNVHEYSVLFWCCWNDRNLFWVAGVLDFFTFSTNLRIAWLCWTEWICSIGLLWTATD